MTFDRLPPSIGTTARTIGLVRDRATDIAGRTFVTREKFRYALFSPHVAALDQAPVSPETGYVVVVAMGEKPDVVVPSDQAPSYQLEIEDIVVGDGDEAVSGHVVEVHYVGVSWKTGQQFDASWDRGSTFKFGLGKGHVIAGWDQGVAGMRVGGRRRITIPPMLAYGKRGAGRVIGPDETLVFVVDLISVR